MSPTIGRLTCCSIVRLFEFDRRHISDRLEDAAIVSVSGVQPTFAAIDVIVSHCEPCAACCSKTNRTARSRISVGYLLFLPMASSYSTLEASGKPGAIYDEVLEELVP